MVTVVCQRKAPETVAEAQELLIRSLAEVPSAQIDKGFRRTPSVLFQVANGHCGMLGTI